MSAMREAREARRRRILERGTHRLAFITGERTTIPPLSPSPSPSLPPQIERELEKVADRLPSQDIAQTSEDPQDESEIVATSEEDRSSQLPPRSDENLQTSNGSHKEGQISRRQKSLSAAVRSLTKALDASQLARALFAFSFAMLLVCRTVLSTCGFTNGDFLDALLPRWPVFLVLVTNLSLAFLWHMRERVEFEEAEPDRSGTATSRVWDMATKLENVISMGLLCKKAISAISLDFSIYVLVVAGGLALAQFSLPSCYTRVLKV